MKFVYVLIASLVVLSACSKRELTCGEADVVAVAEGVIKRSLIGEPDKLAKQLMTSLASEAKTDVEKKQYSEAQALVPKLDWENFFPGVKIAFTNFVSTAKNKDTGKISCEASITSDVFDTRAQGEALSARAKAIGGDDAQKVMSLVNFTNVMGQIEGQNAQKEFRFAYDAQITDDGKTVLVSITNSNVPNPVVKSLNDLSVMSFQLLWSQAMKKFEAQHGGSTKVVEGASAPVVPASATPVPVEVAPAPVQAPVSAPAAVQAAVQASALSPAPAVAAEAAGSFSPSFDCSKVSTGQERLICGSKDLSELDVKLSVAYRQAMEKVSDKEGLKVSQRDWRKFKRDSCSDVACMSKSYSARIDEIAAAK